jgi:hypothetical protein
MKDKLMEVLREAKVVWGLRKFESEQAHKENRPFAESAIDGNIMLNEGINELWTILATAGSGTKFDNTNAYLGVGDSDDAEAASQTGLQAATNKAYVGMDGGYPTYGTDQKATWRATFGSAVANFDWNEFTVANGDSDAAVNLNRKVSDQGTKVAGQVWELTLEITLS